MHELSKGCYPRRHNQNHISYTKIFIISCIKEKPVFGEANFFFFFFFSYQCLVLGPLENIAYSGRLNVQKIPRRQGGKKEVDERYLRLAISLDTGAPLNGATIIILGCSFGLDSRLYERNYFYLA